MTNRFFTIQENEKFSNDQQIIYTLNIKEDPYNKEMNHSNIFVLSKFILVLRTSFCKFIGFSYLNLIFGFLNKYA